MKELFIESSQTGKYKDKTRKMELPRDPGKPCPPLGLKGKGKDVSRAI